MNFSSMIFIFGFLPIVFVLSLIVPNIRIKNIILMIASLFFYAWGEPLCVLLMIVSVFINWILSKFIAEKENSKNILMALSVVLNIGMLIGFKYLGFIAEALNLIPKVSIPVPVIHLPIGISFFTFQILSYVIDVYRDKNVYQKNFFTVLLYISFFPQLIAGPIVKYHDIDKQFDSRKMTVDGAAKGIRRFIIGLSKKLLLADVMAVAVDGIFAEELGLLSGYGAWLGAIFYIFQIYFDFSGYSDMAMGLAGMFGFELLENFRYPYISKSITEFWRRWHISLSTWFKEYLYIPLGGNRKGTVRTYLNLFIVFMATGIWHGANYTFLLWGIYNGILIVLERCKVINIKNKVLAHIYLVFAVIIGFVIFRADTVGDAAIYISRMFNPYAFMSGAADGLVYLNPYFILTVAVAIVCALPIVPKFKSTEITNPKLFKVFDGISYVMSMILFLICFGALAMNSYSPFIYFRF